MQKQNLDQLANMINTRDDFVDFVRVLASDTRQNPTEWENDTVERYLEAIGAWVQDMNGYFINTKQPLPQHVEWRIIGQILLAAKIYE